MVRVDLCLIGAGLMSANLLTHTARSTSKAVQDFQYSLNDEQRMIYSKVIKERMSLYIQGMLLGMLISYLFVTKYKDSIGVGQIACVSATIMSIVTYFYYILRPKKYNMLDYLHNKIQVSLWQKSYRAYQWRYWLGFLSGMVGYGLLTYAIMAGHVNRAETAIEGFVDQVGNKVEAVGKAVANMTPNEIKQLIQDEGYQ